MRVVFDKSVAPSILEAGYSYNPVSNTNTVEVELTDNFDIDESLTGAGLSHLLDEYIYTIYDVH
jgi:hypothetical protein|tara:strand:+ start:342 stop:533 length:192 start_codon:yes stop_codon:yes gene_type:complete